RLGPSPPAAASAPRPGEPQIAPADRQALTVQVLEQGYRVLSRGPQALAKARDRDPGRAGFADDGLRSSYERGRHHEVGRDADQQPRTRGRVEDLARGSGREDLRDGGRRGLALRDQTDEAFELLLPTGQRHP